MPEWGNRARYAGPGTPGPETGTAVLLPGGAGLRPRVPSAVVSVPGGTCAPAGGRAPTYQCMLNPARTFVVVTPPLAGLST